MAYIGKQPTIGNFVKLDSITTSATTTFNLLNGGVAYFPQSANNCIVSLNGVIQSPNTSFTISGSTIVFASALTSTDVIDFILVLGDVLNIGTPSDNTVTASKIADGVIGLGKLSATGTKDATTFLRGDNTFATAGATAGQVIQVVSTSKADVWTASTGTTPTDVTGFNASITPSSASNKVLVLVNFTHSTSGTNATGSALLLRGSTPISKGTTAGSRAQAFAWAGQYGGNWNGVNVSVSYLDSPATTSSTTYKIQIVSEQTSVVGATSRDTDDAYHGRYASNITLMEIKG